MHRIVVVPALALLLASAVPASSQEASSPQDVFWANLQSLCQSAAEGQLLQAPDNQVDPNARLVVHFWECGDEEIRAPFHVGDNHSRTWVFIRHEGALELRHDHRNPDGTEEGNTWYGSMTLTEGSETIQEFVTQRGEVTSGWRVEVVPGVRYSYGTIRNEEWRHHLVFDLSAPVALPPLPWGHETRPSQRP